MMEYITISDDEGEVEVIEDYMTCEPILIDLTNSPVRQASQQQQDSQQQPGRESPRFDESEKKTHQSHQPQHSPHHGSPSLSQQQQHPETQPPQPPEPSQPPETPQPPQPPQVSQHQPQQHSHQCQQSPPTQRYQPQESTRDRPLFNARKSPRRDPPAPRPRDPSPVANSSESPPKKPVLVRAPQFDVRQSHSHIVKQARLWIPNPTGPSRNEQAKESPEAKQNGHVQQPLPKNGLDHEERPKPSEREQMLAKKELGNSRYRSNDLNDAVKLYREANELARKLDDKEMQAILHFNLAMTYSKLGSYNQAADECAEAVRIDDNYIKAHCKRAEIYMAQGKFDDAVICYEYICEIDASKRDDAMKRIQAAREMSKRCRKRDQYEILGLVPGFNIDDIKKSYRMKARAHHPDKHSNADVVTRRIHEKIFKETSEAYAFFQKRYGFH